MKFHSNLPIIGAGLSGLITATQFPHSKIIESMPIPTQTHKSLLRFRTPDIGVMVGIPFKKVKVYKEIFDGDDVYKEPSIMDMNNYAKKVSGLIASRSITNTETVERYVAPDDFYAQLEASMHNRIEYNTVWEFNEPCISTVPLNVTACEFGFEVKQFKYSQNHVLRIHVPNADVYQTIYVTDPTNPIYRASITGDMMMIESMSKLTSDDIEEYVYNVLRCFGLSLVDIGKMERASQRYGKIIPIDERHRKLMISELTLKHGIYSIGRFAVWRNILLDSLVNDINIVKKLIEQDNYDNRKLLV